MKVFRKHFFYFLLFTFAFCLSANATHYRAGEVLYELIGNYKYKVTVITYSKYDGLSVQADKDQVLVSWGDFTPFDTLDRANGVDGDGNGYRDGVIITTTPITIKKNVYIGIHTYPGAPPPPSRFYIIEFQDLNRIDGIANISNGGSIDVPFYVEDTLKFPTDLANIGFNSSPILTNPPIDYANLNDTFFHNPGAYDPDHDSLDFQLVPCLQLHDQQVPLYMYPDDYCQLNGQPNNTITIDRHTGQLIWATPCRVGIFNIAILITEFRNGISLGTMMRDMQIIVDYTPNRPPVIVAAPDTCIRAGDTLRVRITATDPDVVQIVTITAAGGPFQVNQPATFLEQGTNSTTVNGNPAIGIFDWKTDCSHISAQPYIAVFKAQDSYSVPLVDVETWQIKVIAPPPKNLTAVATNHNVTLNWQNPYFCSSSPDFRGFSVWRKDGCDLFDPEYCETGLAGRGYIKLTGANILLIRM